MALPLFCVVLVSMIKDAYEDYNRAKNDKGENETNKTKRFNPESNEFEETPWQNLRVGNIIRVEED